MAGLLRGLMDSGTHLMGLGMLVLTVVSGGRNGEPKADAKDRRQEFGHAERGNGGWWWAFGHISIC